jgi:myo-inositol-1-phosphate synthase
MNNINNIAEAKGNLGVLIVGLGGAVATTFVAGLLSIRNGYGKPIGSLTQLGTLRIGDRSNNEFPLIKDFLPLANLNDIVIGGWDIRPDNCYEAAKQAKVLKLEDLEPISEELENIEPMKGVFERYYVKNLTGTHVKKGNNKFELMEQLRADIRSFKFKNNCSRLVVIWCGSTEIFFPANGIHSDLKKFDQGMVDNHLDISPSMLYAYAAIAEGVPFINGAPNLTNDVPALIEFAKAQGVPVAGKDFKTGQTLIKTVISPMLKARMLGLNGWFSTNILGNRDGEVLDDPGSFKTKEESKLSVLDHILQPDLYPLLYKKYSHQVRINYYPPAGDNKEGWDNIDIFGWLGYPMQLKINFLCRDSILAAPIVLDLILFIDLAARVGLKGIQDWLSFYFKSPIHEKDKIPEHDLFIQQMKLKNTLRVLGGAKPVSHTNENDEIFAEMGSENKLF